VIPDTNVLLAPYRASTETLEAIRRTYQTLRSENRVLVPAQVAREFARNRLDLLAQAHKYVRDAKGVAINGKFDPPPILFVTSEYKEARQQLDTAAAALKAYRNSLDKLSAVIAGWHSTDPVLEVYAKIFDREVVRELSVDANTLEEIRKTRYEARVPPGFRDKAKDDGGVGDLAIWLTILEAAAQAKRDAIFVSEETKVDWFHRSPDEKVFPRYELVEEFSLNVPGKSFGIMTLAELLKAYGASEEVVEEVRETAAASEAPFWRARSDLQKGSLERITSAQIAVRLGNAGARLRLSEADDAPDLFVTVGEELLGVSTVVTTVRGPRVIRSVAKHIQHARAAAEKYDLNEHVVVLASEDITTIEVLGHWLAEDNYQGPRVAVVLAFIDGPLLRIVKNQAEHPFFRQALSDPAWMAG
jgi:hypothetical protein